MGKKFFPDKTDFDILNRLQEDFPLVPEPWSVIAKDLGMPPDELFSRLSNLRNAGILRGVTPVLNSQKFGLKSGTLVAIHIKPEKEAEAAGIINSFPEISHNYIRDHHYSVWFTVKAESKGRVDEIIAEIMEKTGIDEDDMLNLPTVCSYKTDVRFCCREPQTAPDIGQISEYGGDIKWMKPTAGF